MFKPFLLLTCAFASANIFAQGVGIKALSPYDVVVPSLNTDPAANARVVGQLYYNVSGGGSFRAVDKNGNITTFNTSGATISGVTAGTGLLGGGTSGTVALAADVGTGPNQIVQLDATGKLPAVDGSQLTNLPSAGANFVLSNLSAPTAINQNLLPGSDLTRSLGSDDFAWSSVHASVYSGQGSSGFFPNGEATLAMGENVALTTNHGEIAISTRKFDGPAPIFIRTNIGPFNSSSAGGSGAITISSGDFTSNDPTGNLILKTGTTPSPSLRGRITLVDGSEGIAGHVWTSTDASGSGRWALAPYSAGAPTDWAGAPPTTVAEAIDRLAALAKALNGGSPIP